MVTYNKPNITYLTGIYNLNIHCTCIIIGDQVIMHVQPYPLSWAIRLSINRIVLFLCVDTTIEYDYSLSMIRI